MPRSFASLSSSFEDSPIPPPLGLGLEDSASSPAFSDILDDLDSSRLALTPATELSPGNLSSHAARASRSRTHLASSSNSASAISNVSDSPQLSALIPGPGADATEEQIRACAAEAMGRMNSENSQQHETQNYPFINYRAPEQPKRARRKASEVNRTYMCNFESCDKGYGTLTHLNGHVKNKQHGPKRLASEFKDMRDAIRPPGRRRSENARRRAPGPATHPIVPSNGISDSSSTFLIPNNLQSAFTPSTIHATLPTAQFTPQEDVLYQANGHDMFVPFLQYDSTRNQDDAFAQETLHDNSALPTPLNDPFMGD